MRRKPAFALVELLVVIAVIAILAALLFPVFARARESARQAACISNFKQQAMSFQMYEGDYDGMMPPSYSGDESTLASSCQIVYQTALQPYMKNTQIYRCPSDPANDDQRATIDLPLPQGPQFQDQRNFNLAFKNDFGFNFQYLSPIFLYTDPATSKYVYYSVPSKEADINLPAETILGVDSVWDRDQNGTPFGGGNAGVDPPCYLYSDGTSSLIVNGSLVPGSERFGYGGWQPSSPKAGNAFGHTWRWHGEFTTVAFCDGHVKALNMAQLTAGCKVEDDSNGPITDRATFLWDLQ